MKNREGSNYGTVQDLSMDKLLLEYNYICFQCDEWYAKKKEFENEFRRRAKKQNNN